MKCKNCGQEYESKFCPNCGIINPNLKVCKNCGKNYEGDICPDCKTPNEDLYTCKKCGQGFNGKYCPSCGKRSQKTKVRDILLLTFAFSFLFCCIIYTYVNWDKLGSNSEPKKEIPTQTEIKDGKLNIEYYITATELLEEADENGVAADNKYKDKIIQVTGKIRSIDTDILNQSYITLGNDNNEYSLIKVQCYFEKKDIEQLVNLKVDETVTIYGTYSKSTLGISLKKCQIVTE